MRWRRPSLKRKIATTVAVLGLVYALAVTALAWYLVRPPRPRISASHRPTVGLAVEDRDGRVRITSVASPASEAGLRPGDLVLRAWDLPVYSAADLEEHFRNLAPGERLRLEARRLEPDGAETAVMVDIPSEVRPVSPEDYGLPYVDVALTNDRGMTLRGWYVAPAFRVTGGSPAVVFGHDRDTDRRQWLAVAPRLHRAGIAQLFLDFAGRGDSEGSTVTLGIDEAADLEAGVDFLVGTPGIDPDRISLAGRGMGAAAAVLAAFRDPRVSRLVLDSPYTDLMRAVDENLAAHHIPAVLFRGPALAVAAIWARFDPYEIRPVERVESLDVPILLFHGVDDAVVDFNHAWEYHKAAPDRVRLVQMPGLGHHDPRPASYAETIAAYVAE